MANETYSFEIAAEVTRARKEIAAFAKETQKQLDGIKSDGSTTALATGFLAVKDIATSAFRIISSVVNTAISESLEAEKANIQLANSMKLVGDFTADALKEFDDYAEALSKTSEASDDQIKASLALAKSFTLTNAEAKRVVTAATELSAVTGDSLNSSVEKLAKTFNGTISKELKQIIPELKTFTEEQLRSGDAVDAVANRFKGNAAVINDSFGGALGQIKKSISNLLEELGNVITRTQAFKDALRGTSGEIDAITKAIADGNFKELFFNLEVGEGFSDVSKRLNKIKVDAAGGEAAVKALSEEFARLKEKGKSSDLLIQQNRAANAAREKALEEFNSIRKSLELSGLTDIEKINKESSDKIKTIRAAINTGAIKNTKEIQKQIAGIELDRIKKTAEAEKQAAEKLKADLAKIRAENDKFGTNPAGAVTDALISGQKINSQQAANAGAGFVKNVLEGSEGAKKLIVEAGSTAVLALTGIPKEVSGPILDALSQGPEKVRQTVREFTKSIPEIIKNIIASLPVLIEELARTLPPALAKTMPIVAQSFSIELVKNIPNIIRGFAEGLVEAAKQFVQAIIDQVKSVGGLLGGGSGGGGGFLSDIPVIGDIAGGIGDIVGGIGDIFGVNKTDSRERFVPQDSQPLIVNLTVGQSQLARTILDLNRGGFRTS